MLETRDERADFNEWMRVASACLILCVSAISFQMMPDKDNAFSTGVRSTLGGGARERAIRRLTLHNKAVCARRCFQGHTQHSGFLCLQKQT